MAVQGYGRVTDDCVQPGRLGAELSGLERQVQANADRLWGDSGIVTSPRAGKGLGSTFLDYF